MSTTLLPFEMPMRTKSYRAYEVNGGSNLPCKYLFSNVEVYARVAARMKSGRRMHRAKARVLLPVFLIDTDYTLPSFQD